MSLHLLGPSAIRHHLRALGTRISPFHVSLPNQTVNILLTLPILVFLALYIYNQRKSAHVKTALEFEKVVWPQYFGFPDWYGKPEVPFGTGGAGNDEEPSLQAIESPWNLDQPSKDITHGHSKRILGLIPSDPQLHEQSTFLHDLQALSATSNDFEVVLREGEDLEPVGSECWDWVITFGSFDPVLRVEGCNPVIINEPNMLCDGFDPIRELRHNITLLTEANNQQIHAALGLLYGESFKHTKNPPPTELESTIGLVHQSSPSADPLTFFPNRHMSGWKRKRVTLFLGTESQRAVTEDFGRKEVIRDLLPRGWSVFFEKDPLQSSKWQSVTGQQVPQDWEEAMRRRLDYNQEVAKTMRNSGICLFAEEWPQRILSHRMIQAMLSGCVVATVTPSVYKNAIPDLIVPLDPLKSLSTAFRGTGSIASTLLPQLVQISGIISAYTAEDLDEKALWAFMFARERFTTRRKLYEVGKVVEMWRAGGRGLQLPGGFHDI